MVLISEIPSPASIHIGRRPTMSLGLTGSPCCALSAMDWAWAQQIVALSLVALLTSGRSPTTGPVGSQIQSFYRNYFDVFSIKVSDEYISSEFCDCNEVALNRVLSSLYDVELLGQSTLEALKNSRYCKAVVTPSRGFLSHLSNSYS